MNDSPNEPIIEERQELKRGSSVGPMAATVIIVILLAVGGLYFFITREIKLHQQPLNEQVNS